MDEITSKNPTKLILDFYASKISSINPTNYRFVQWSRPLDTKNCVTTDAGWDYPITGDAIPFCYRHWGELIRSAEMQYRVHISLAINSAVSAAASLERMTATSKNPCNKPKTPVRGILDSQRGGKTQVWRR
jgi:hypothetical protein